MTPKAMQLMKRGSMLVAFLPSLAGCASTAMVTPNAQKPSSFVTAGLGERVRTASLAITPLSVLEDSRCPTNVQCIQAGTVRISVRLQKSAVSSIVTIGLLAPYQLGKDWVHLVAVCPYPRHPVEQRALGYRFTFGIGTGKATPSYKGSCKPR